MKQTEQYGLNQWELQDRIRMEDFNADNAKIEAALGGKLGQVEALSDIHFDSAASFAFGISSDSLNNWAINFLVVTAEKVTGPTEREIGFFFTGTSEPFITTASFPVMVAFFPLHDENRPVQGIVFGSHASPFVLDIPFKGNQYGMIRGVNCDLLIEDIHVRRYGIR